MLTLVPQPARIETRDEQVARQFSECHFNGCPEETLRAFVPALAQLIRDEREACAQLADQAVVRYGEVDSLSRMAEDSISAAYQLGRRDEAYWLAQAIRDRDTEVAESPRVGFAASAEGRTTVHRP